MPKLSHITLQKIIDAAFFCGTDGTPVYVYIAGPTGIGKTWASEALREELFVDYKSKCKSPSELRLDLSKNFNRTKLFINDDLGLNSRWNVKDLYATYIMMMDGELGYSAYKTNVVFPTLYSMVLLSTDLFLNEQRNTMAGMGLLDRVLLVPVGLSAEKRKEYQERALATMNGRSPPKRRPTKHFIRNMENDRFPLIDYDINPRNINNLKYLQKYLNDEEMDELIAIANADLYRYQI